MLVSFSCSVLYRSFVHEVFCKRYNPKVSSRRISLPHTPPSKSNNTEVIFLLFLCVSRTLLCKWLRQQYQLHMGKLCSDSPCGLLDLWWAVNIYRPNTGSCGKNNVRCWIYTTHYCLPKFHGWKMCFRRVFIFNKSVDFCIFSDLVDAASWNNRFTLLEAAILSLKI